MIVSDKKRQDIRSSLKATREKRKHQKCRVFELKITKNKLSKTASTHMSRLFLEAKWFYNWILAQPDVFNVDTRIKNVPVKCGEKFEERPFHCLSSQMKQALLSRVHSSIRTLVALKAKGKKIGGLKFKRSVKAIPLKQHGITYKFTNNGKRFSCQLLKRPVRIRGYSQLPAGAELANAVLLKRGGDYYLKLTVFVNKKAAKETGRRVTRSIGVDPGIKYQIVFSNGIRVEYRVPVSKHRKLRRLYRKFSRKKKGSRNRYKAKLKLIREFQRLTNIKRDIINKLVAFTTAHYDIVCYQKENLKGWQRLWGARMLDTALGSFLKALSERAGTASEVDRFYPSTQLCSTPGCPHKQKMPLDARVYHCPICGSVLDRDYNASCNIEQEGLLPLTAKMSILGEEHHRSHACGDLSSTLAQQMADYFNTIPRVFASQVNESGSPLRSFSTKSESWG